MKKYLRKVVESDCRLLFEWANEELVRKNSFNSNKIIYEEHIIWFKNKLRSVNCLMYLFYINEIAVGQVRMDTEDVIGTISYSLNKNYRGKGLAIEMLKLFENEVYKNNINIKQLIGYVKTDNLPSQKIFEKLKYHKVKDKNKLRYYKYI